MTERPPLEQDIREIGARLAAAFPSAARHPKTCATGPLAAKLNMIPAGTAIMNTASARERQRSGTMSAIQLVAEASLTPGRDATITSTDRDVVRVHTASGDHTIPMHVAEQLFVTAG